jgi:large subunit ribosomal protein L15
MQLHQLKPDPKRKKGIRLGRGRKKGTYCGRGVKGQKARAGRKLKPIVREILKRYPKLRGYRFKAKKDYVILNFKEIEGKFKENEKVNPEILVRKKLIKRIGGKIPKVKILSKGEIKTPLVFEDCLFSQKAKEKIKKAGGKIL